MTTPSLTVAPEEALRERARREKARRHLVDFSEYIFPWYRAARHHRLVAEYLEQVETFIRSKGATGIGRLLIELPPRHGKSEQVSKHFPAWVLGRQADTRIILASYGADLATANSRAARDIVAASRYQAVFGDLSTIDAPVELSTDSRSVESWDLAAPHRGGVVAAGVGGGITGKGAHLLIVDDPFKNRDEAESETYRDRVWDWWTSSAYTRLEDGAAVIGMFTRWHGDDWAGRLLKLMANDPAADQYVVVCMPAIWEEPAIPEGKTFGEHQREQLHDGVWIDREDPLGRQVGEALWPQKYDEADLARIRANIGEYDWEALYQQQPYLRSGNIFRREWFTIVEQAPKQVVKRVRYWDKAATAGGGAYSAGVCMSLGADGFIYVEHVNRGQWSTYQRDEEIVKTGKADKELRPGHTVIWHEQEPGGSGVDSAKETNRKLALAGLEAHFEPVTGDKVVRAGPWSSACEAGMVRLVRGGWNQAFIEEHAAFPKGRFKDQVDGSSGAYSKVQSNTIQGQLFY